MLKKPLTMLLLDDDKTASDGSELPWCRFPASLHSNPVLRPTTLDIDIVVSGLHMLEKPPPRASESLATIRIHTFAW
jgi:hypothetical protein